MAFCQTWTSSSQIRHPWFDAPVTKRKHRDTLDRDPNHASEPGTHHANYGRDQPLSLATFAESSRVPFGLRAASGALPPSAKRQRCSLVESGLARLSLSSTASAPGTSTGDAYPHVDEPSGYPSVSASFFTQAKAQTQAQDGSATMDLDMNGECAPPAAAQAMRPPPTWYEPAPNRIVITDLDAFAQENDDAEEERRRGRKIVESAQTSEGQEGVHVNEVLLAHIMRRAGRREARTLPKEHEGTKHALVLFKPLPLTTFEREGAEERARVSTTESAQQQQQAIYEEVVTIDDDAMDVEP